MSAAAPAPGSEGSISCPRCAGTVGPEQDWCLACGDAARTRLAPTPSWKAPIAIVALIAVVAGVVLAVAFVAITANDAPVQTTSTAAAPAGPSP